MSVPRGSVNKKDASLNEEHQRILRELLAQPENKICADCHGSSPRWASANLGVFLCIGCSGLHRKIGTHISQVRSTSLDTWTPEQIASIQKRGNAWAQKKFEATLPSNFQRPDPNSNPAAMERFIRDKYERRLYFAKEPAGGSVSGTIAATHADETVHTSPAYQSSSQPSRNHQQQHQEQQYSGGSATLLSRNSRSYEKRSGVIGLAPGANMSPFEQAQSANRPREEQMPARLPSGAPGGAVARTTTVTPSAKQRAALVIRLNDMGYTTGQAALAIENSGMDLESCVAWLLDNAGIPQNGGISAKAAAPQNSIDASILFEDVAPPAVAPAPTSTAAHTANPRKIAPPTAAQTQNSFAASNADDWADFGQFTSAAMPAATPAPKSTPETAAATTAANNDKNDLIGMLGSLYVGAAAPAHTVPYGGSAPPSLVTMYSNLPINPPPPPILSGGATAGHTQPPPQQHQSFGPPAHHLPVVAEAKTGNDSDWWSSPMPSETMHAPAAASSDSSAPLALSKVASSLGTGFDDFFSDLDPIAKKK